MKYNVFGFFHYINIINFADIASQNTVMWISVIKKLIVIHTEFNECTSICVFYYQPSVKPCLWLFSYQNLSPFLYIKNCLAIKQAKVGPTIPPGTGSSVMAPA